MSGGGEDGAEAAPGAALERSQARLDIQARDFLYASIRYDCRRRRLAITVLSVALIVALAAAGIAVIQQNRAQDGERLAIARQLIAQANAIQRTDPRTAARLGLATHRIQPGGEARTGLINTLTSNPHYANTLTSPGPVLSVVFAPDGRTLATGSDDGTVMWQMTPSSNTAT